MSKRVSLILRDADEAMIAPFLHRGSPAFEVLRQWANHNDHVSGDISSDAAVLRILLRVGAEAMHEQILDAGYAQLASEFNSASRKFGRLAARRRSTSQSDELG
ncbi:Uncharacterised protein [Mycobacteroides abscessus subsp. massiliense]|nr:Uncharacterised protein [Mycobacteroides abscessus subsp. massiliense]SLI18587.1 Uncharacterised protein [Mycobacteroides abscessus subsp. massiliense]